MPLSLRKTDCIRFSVIAGLALSIFCLPGCSNNQVTITKQPLTVSKVYIESAPKKDVPVGPGEEAATTWKFGCKTDFDFDILEKTQLQDNDYMVTIKITKAHLTLSAPVVIWISKTAPEGVLRHEMGHVKICQRVYESADKDAVDAARAVIGREYQASAATVEGAASEAIVRASEDVYSRYHETATEAINRISSIFDELEAPDAHAKGTRADDIETHLEQAFSRYQGHIGVKEK